jgi:hypothetical protein
VATFIKLRFILPQSNAIDTMTGCSTRLRKHALLSILATVLLHAKTSTALTTTWYVNEQGTASTEGSTSRRRMWDPSQKELKICSIVNGLDLTRLQSYRLRVMFRNAMEDVELMREYISEAMLNDGLLDGLSNLTAMAHTCNWQDRNLPPNSTTLDAGLGWVDDRASRRIDRHVSTATDPMVGTKHTDMALIDTVSNILPWIQDRRAKEQYWSETHQNGRSEGPTKDELIYSSLYLSTWAVTTGDAIAYYPPLKGEQGSHFPLRTRWEETLTIQQFRPFFKAGHTTIRTVVEFVTRYSAPLMQMSPIRDCP